MIYLANEEEGIGRHERVGKRRTFRRQDPQLPESCSLGGGSGSRRKEGHTLAGVCCTGSTRSYAQKALIAALSAGLVFGADPSLQSRVVTVEKQDIVPVYAAYNFSTLVVLPAKEEVMDVTSGESSFWAIDKYKTSIAIKPKLLVKLAKKDIDPTNINIMAASGNVYSIVVCEISQKASDLCGGSGKPPSADLKVLLEQKDTAALANIEHPKFVSSDIVETLKRSLEESQKQVSRTAISEAKEIRHDYEWRHGKEAEAFGLKSIYHDSRFTYIEAVSQNAPALYEVIDGKESVVQYGLENGKYCVDHIISEGVLRAGKTKLQFERNKETL
jgi:type IV secretion system protein VirB9